VPDHQAFTEFPATSRDELDAALVRATDNWSGVRWRGHRLWQNLLDLNVITEHLFATRPAVIVETGTYCGGSAICYADLMRLAGLAPDVVSIDIDPLATPVHLGVRYLTGRSSTDDAVAKDVAAHVNGRRAFVILDSDHHADHVYHELLLYAPFVAPGDYVLVQDGSLWSTHGLPVDETPIGGILRFLAVSPHFRIDVSKSPFPTTSHVHGWLHHLPASSGILAQSLSAS